MHASHVFPVIKFYGSLFTLGEQSSENTLTQASAGLPSDTLFATPTESGSKSAGGGIKDGAEKDAIRDESGLGSGAGVLNSGSEEASNRSAGVENTGNSSAGEATDRSVRQDGSVDITEGGTDAGGTDFGANMGSPTDTGGIDVSAIGATGDTGGTEADRTNPTAADEESKTDQ